LEFKKNVVVDEKNLWAYFPPLLPEQSRSARAWLDWSQEELAAKASVSLSTVRDFEKGRREPIPNNLAAMRAALESAGVSFVDSSGITYTKRGKRR
jgi:ribosome-binding protein aMBF1 (putative translation factor)